MMASDDREILKVICYNMHGFYQGYPLLEELVRSDQPDVMLLQEHWLTPANMHKFDSYFLDYFSFGCSAMAKTVETGMLRGRPFGGVITLINNALRTKTKTIHCTDRYVVTRVANYLFVNVYLRCIGTPDRILICDEILGEVSEWCRYYSDCEVVMAGDFNVSLDSCDVVAKRISDFALDCAMCCVMTFFPTKKLPPILTYLCNSRVTSITALPLVPVSYTHLTLPTILRV